MTGISYDVVLNDSDMRRRLEDLIEKMGNAEGFYKNVGEHLLNSVKDNFENEQSPAGEKWQRLSATTLARRAMRGESGKPVLNVSGALLGSLNYEADDTSTTIGTPIVYAAIQHFGGESKGYMKGATIPARPFLGLSDDDQVAIIEIAEDWLEAE